MWHADLPHLPCLLAKLWCVRGITTFIKVYQGAVIVMFSVPRQRREENVNYFKCPLKSCFVRCISGMTEYDNMVISLANHKKALYDRRLSHER